MVFVWENMRADSDQKWAMEIGSIGERLEAEMNLNHPVIRVILHTSDRDAIIAVPYPERTLHPNAKQGCSE